MMDPLSMDQYQSQATWSWNLTPSDITSPPTYGRWTSHLLQLILVDNPHRYERSKRDQNLQLPTELSSSPEEISQLPCAAWSAGAGSTNLQPPGHPSAKPEGEGALVRLEPWLAYYPQSPDSLDTKVALWLCGFAFGHGNAWYPKFYYNTEHLGLKTRS